ncbi:hypothetical protein HKX48_005722 [Thoreauomyces humboldtii]|nr:hypothetical protein HKX48_005722 [Thoreauomyces humboldtii]
MTVLDGGSTQHQQEQHAPDLLTKLVSPTLENVLSTIKRRYAAGDYFTKLGENALLVLGGSAVLAESTAQVASEYARWIIDTSEQKPDLPPHIFDMAASCFYHMTRDFRNQSVVFLGSDASEKSEVRKLFAWQLLMLSTNTQDTGDQKILRAATMMDPVFEAFAHARTLRSRSASLACKYVEYQYNHDWKLVGVGSIAYHLDGSRFATAATGPAKDEQYPIFFYMLSGVTDEEKSRWKLHDASHFRYLQGSPFFHTATDDQKAFIELQKALKHLRISHKLQRQVWQVLAAVLHLGNLNFHDDENRPQEPCSIVNGEELFIAANLLGVDQSYLEDALVFKSKVFGNERISLFLKSDMASAQRDLLASTLYSELMSWLVRRMNACLCKSYDDEVAASIRVFEVPSFRETGTNELNRLLYNMVNENLQMHVASFIDQRCEEYAQEGVLSFAVENSQDRLAAVSHLLSLDIGLLSAIDEEARDREARSNGKDFDMTIPSSILHAFDAVEPVVIDDDRISSRYFTVHHYCGSATYHLDELARLDVDALSPAVTSIFTGNAAGMAPCANGFVRNLFSKEDLDVTSNHDDLPSVISTFQRNTEQVMTAIKDATPWFVVCVDAGESPLSDKMDVQVLHGDLVSNQIPQQIQNRVAGDYAGEYTHEEFISRFHSVVMSSSFDNSDEIDFASLCEDFAAEMGWTEEHMALGLTKVFLSEKVWRVLQDRLRAFEGDNTTTPWQAQPSDFAATLRRPIADGDTDSEMMTTATDLDAKFPDTAKPKYELEEKEPEREQTSSRQRWLCCTWSLTWCCCPVFLKTCGKMTRKDVQMAWREKVALCMIIAFMCLFLLAFIIGLPKVLCPKQRILSLDELRVRTNTHDPWVYGYGKAYSISNILASHQAGGIDMHQFDAALGKDVSGLFYKVDSFADFCPGITPPAAGWDNLAERPLDYSLRHATPGSEYFQQLQLAAKYDVAYRWDYIEQQPLLNSSWIVLHEKVYDISTYHTSPFFANPVIDRIFAGGLGNDISPSWNSLVVRPDPKTAAAVEHCMDNMFYIGVIDHRLDFGCQFSNYVLLASSMVIITIIGLKFLVAVQFTSTPVLDPAKLEQFVICQMPCYTEGEASLRKSLESLAVMDYEGPRKLLFVICDGMVVGSGNNRPTPRIVLDILANKEEPESFVFQSVGEGDQQLNRAKVYTGLYTVRKGDKEHTVPYIVVVKVGKDSEVGRPGNRGKRDSQLLLLKFLNRVQFNADLEPLELELYRIMTEVIGIHPSQYSLLFYVDADTEVYPDSLGHLVHTMNKDPSIIGLCGETILANKSETWITRIQVYEYFISHHLAKAFEAIFGSVTCLPGCFCMYRIRSAKGAPLVIAPEIVDEFSQNNIDTLHLKSLFDLGEDRFLTTLVLKHFSHMKCTFINHAKCKTSAPDQWRVLLSQRRRWINSTVHNLLELMNIRQCGFLCCSMKFVVFLDLLSTVLQPAAVLYIGYLIYVIVTQQSALPTISLAMIAAIYGLQVIVFVLKREFKQIIWMFLYMFGIPVFTFLLPLYAFWHFDDFSWGNTRVVYGEDGKKKKVSAETRKFDPESVPRRRWREYSKQKQMDEAEAKMEQDEIEKRRLSYRVMSYAGGISQTGSDAARPSNRAVVLSNSHETLPQYRRDERSASPVRSPVTSASPVLFQYTSTGRHSKYSSADGQYLPHTRTHSPSPSGYQSDSSTGSADKERAALEGALCKAKASRDLAHHHPVPVRHLRDKDNEEIKPVSTRGLAISPLPRFDFNNHNHGVFQDQNFPGHQVEAQTALNSGGRDMYHGAHENIELQGFANPQGSGQLAMPAPPERRSSMVSSLGSPPPSFPDQMERRPSQQTIESVSSRSFPAQVDRRPSQQTIGSISSPAFPSQVDRRPSQQTIGSVSSLPRVPSVTFMQDLPGSTSGPNGIHGQSFRGQLNVPGREYNGALRSPAEERSALFERVSEHKGSVERTAPTSEYSSTSTDQTYSEQPRQAPAPAKSKPAVGPSFAFPIGMDRRASQLSISSTASAAKGKQAATIRPAMPRRQSDSPSMVSFPMPHPAERRNSELSVGGMLRRRDFHSSSSSDLEGLARAAAASISPSPTLIAREDTFPPDDVLLSETRRIVESSDLMAISKKTVRDSLSAFFKVDLESKKALINGFIDELLDAYIRQAI